ncbi:MAG: apolipoprotein N-acyltransferase [Alphaproteobacteria bacterium]|nr:apolipoprotein N-acyltransferase [Alphaproteobacteria bacterium SS10]
MAVSQAPWAVPKPISLRPLFLKGVPGQLDAWLAPLERPAAWCAALKPWKRMGLAFLLGALAVLSLAPLNFLPALPIAWIGFAWLFDGVTTKRGGFATAWAFGFGYLAFGLYWISAALFTDIGKYWWLVPFAVTLLPAGLAIFWGLAGLAVTASGAKGTGRFLALVAAFTLAEFLRGTVLTGFPWNLVGYGLAGSEALLQGAALISSYGLSLFAIAVPLALATLCQGKVEARLRLALPLLAIIGTVALWSWGAARLSDNPTTYHASTTVRLIQPNVQQTEKWDAENRREILNRLITLSTQPPDDDGDTIPPIIIWPETAVPYALGIDEAARTAVSLAIPYDGYLLTGTPHREPLENDNEEGGFRYHNSVITLNAAGDALGRYDKVKLVPFGEFLPLRSILRPLGMDAIAAGSSDFSPGQRLDATYLPPLLPPSLPRPLPMVCYEVIFPGLFSGAVSSADWIVTVTNDAWFGATAGPHQHFFSARMRAIETGLPVVRVANTGISGVIDGHGRVLVQSAINTADVLDMPLPKPVNRATPDGSSELNDASHFTPMWFFYILLIGWIVITVVTVRSTNKTAT